MRPAEGVVVGFWPTKRRAVPSAPGILRTRHPMLGAAERRAALLVNVLTRCELANCACYQVGFRRSALTSLYCSPRFERMLFLQSQFLGGPRHVCRSTAEPNRWLEDDGERVRKACRRSRA